MDEWKFPPSNKVWKLVEDLHWTTEQPTKPGYYWAMRSIVHEAIIVEVYKIKKGKLAVSVFGQDNKLVVSDFMYWLGPLPEPSKP